MNHGLLLIFARFALFIASSSSSGEGGAGGKGTWGLPGVSELVGVEEGMEDPHDPNYDSDSQVSEMPLRRLRADCALQLCPLIDWRAYSAIIGHN